MEDHAWLVNVARGRHVVTDDLVDALRDGVIGGAGLDVTDPEPLPARPPAVVAAELPHHAPRRQHARDGRAAARRADHAPTCAGSPTARSSSGRSTSTPGTDAVGAAARRRGARRPARRRRPAPRRRRADARGDRRSTPSSTRTGAARRPGRPGARPARRRRAGRRRRRRRRSSSSARRSSGAARAALARPPRDEHAGQPDDRRKVLDAFVRDGRITHDPGGARQAPRGARLAGPGLRARAALHGARGQRDPRAPPPRHRGAAPLPRRRGAARPGGGEYWRSGGTVT